MTDRKWWPANLLDEVMPLGRSDPTAWVVGRQGDGFALAGFDEEEQAPEEREVIAVGGVVDFCWSEDRGCVGATINPDGTFELHGEVPADVTHFWEQYDTDTIADSMEEFAKNWAENAKAAGDSLPMRITVSLYTWSDEIPHQLVVVDGRPQFIETTKPQIQ